MRTTFQKTPRVIAHVFLLCLLLTVVNARAAVDFYSPDKNHLWNRLYAGLLVLALEFDGMVFDDVLDPPYFSNTKHLLSGEPHTNALALLREFSANPAVLREMSPLHRAMMQRDLNALVHWLHRSPAAPEQQNLAKALVQAIRFIALPDEDIRKLPDNYARAVANSDAPTFDPKQPDRGFLPPDLLSQTGPWLTLEPTVAGEPLPAPMHFRAFTGRSVVEVRFRHADGREAGEKYLKELTEVPKNPPLAKQAAATPQFPPGTMWALVRRAILVDPEGKLVVSPLVESVELRFYHTIVQGFSQGQVGTGWELSRRLLFGAGGFHRTTSLEQAFWHFFDYDKDRFEGKDRFVRFHEPAAVCQSCHMEPGVLSVQSHTRSFRNSPTPARSDLRPTTTARAAEGAVGLAREKGGWKFLRRLWAEK